MILGCSIFSVWTSCWACMYTTCSTVRCVIVSWDTLFDWSLRARDLLRDFQNSDDLLLPQAACQCHDLFQGSFRKTFLLWNGVNNFRDLCSFSELESSDTFSRLGQFAHWWHCLSVRDSVTRESAQIAPSVSRQSSTSEFGWRLSVWSFLDLRWTRECVLIAKHCRCFVDLRFQQTGSATMSATKAWRCKPWSCRFGGVAWSVSRATHGLPA